MTIKQWLDSRVGKMIDDDGWYGTQCMDLYADYQRNLLQVTVKGASAAKDVWTTFNPDVFTKIPNTPTGVPIRGDVVIWGTQTGQWGHIAIAEGEGNTSWFVSLDQNWPFSNGTTPAKYIRHDYTGVLGWLRPKKDINYDQAAVDAARIAEQNRLNAIADAEAKEAKRVADELAKLAKEAAEAKILADELEAERLAKIEAERLAEEQRVAEEIKQEASEEEPIKGEVMIERFKSPVVLLSLLSQILLIVGLFIPQLSDTVKIVGTALVEMLTLVGVLNNPTDPENF